MIKQHLHSLFSFRVNTLRIMICAESSYQGCQALRVSIAATKNLPICYNAIHIRPRQNTINVLFLIAEGVVHRLMSIDCLIFNVSIDQGVLYRYFNVTCATFPA